MDNRRPLSPQQQNAYAYRQQRRIQLAQQEKMKKRRRKRFIRKCILLACMFVITVFAVLLVVQGVKFAVNMISSMESDPYEGLYFENPQIIYLPEPPEPPLVIKTEPDEPYPGVPYIDYYYGVDQELPQAYSTADYEHYQNWEEDNPLFTLDNGITIVIDAGHQVGTWKSNVWLSPYLDPANSSSWVNNHLMKIGATGSVSGVKEYVITHTVAEKLKAALEKEGYTVILSHPDVNAQISGAERAAVANKNNADLMITLHCDDYSDSSVSGAGAWVPSDTWDGYPSDRLSYLSYEAGQILIDEYCAATGMKNRGCKRQRDTSMFAFCKVPIVLFEMGYMSNSSDDKNLNSESFQKKIVEGLVNGINKYFDLLWT